jgi:Uma2 family endonuclease
MFCRNVEEMNKTKPAVKYHKDKTSGLRYKRTLILTIQGPNLYWSYDTKKQKLEIYEEKMLKP